MLIEVYSSYLFFRFFLDSSKSTVSTTRNTMFTGVASISYRHRVQFYGGNEFDLDASIGRSDRFPNQRKRQQFESDWMYVRFLLRVGTHSWLAEVVLDFSPFACFKACPYSLSATIHRANIGSEVMESATPGQNHPPTFDFEGLPDDEILECILDMHKPSKNPVVRYCDSLGGIFVVLLLLEQSFGWPTTPLGFVGRSWRRISLA